MTLPLGDVGESEDGVDGGFEWARVELDLREEQPSLNRCEQGDREVVGTNAFACREVPGGLEGAQPVGDDS